MKTTDRFISVSFRYFHNVDDIGQSIDSWRVDGSLPDLIEKLVYLTANGITKVSSDGILLTTLDFQIQQLMILNALMKYQLMRTGVL
ncbi:hypothetical protein EIN43_26985 (plasmid) [Enterobacter hormaechei]|uniref:Uncharacterized protein n=1 Tax=Enterobacter hormaechei TaxID=158836 RepID=A0A4Y5ZSD6_9ENTR|nr:hypothetical protein EIN43_26985 [Enterobacter hormaechei]